MSRHINIIGAGLAGCEAAWQVASRGVKVNLYEMRPAQMTPAHKTSDFAELVCSNSLRSNQLTNAVGLLKEEMRMQDSLIISTADEHALPAGGALAVDREGFAKAITEKISNHPLITIFKQEVTEINYDEITIIASGPLSSPKLSESISKMLGEEHLYFFDAAAPIITKESIDFSKAFYGSRYEEGKGDYINCPMNEQEYLNFYDALINAKVQDIKDFEDEKVFEGCMPIEEMAKRGEKTLLFGPLKPVGLGDSEHHAVVQLRQDNKEGTLFNLVGFQTRLSWGEQKRVFRMIPGLENAEFVRLGVMHRNTFINAPKSLKATGQLKKNGSMFMAGQISGVEGYVESAASGLICGVNAVKVINNQEPLIWPSKTAHGALLNYITTSPKDSFQPMNINFGLLPELSVRIRKRREKRLKISSRAINELKSFLNSEFKSISENEVK